MLTYRSSVVKYIEHGRNGTKRQERKQTEKEKGRARTKNREGIFFHQNHTKLEINHRKRNRKRTNTWNQDYTYHACFFLGKLKAALVNSFCVANLW